MSFMQQMRATRPVDTNGWDTVSAVKVSEMNAAIAAAGTSPAGFEIAPDDKIRAEGRFGDWMIGPGGDGHLLNLVIPLMDTSLTFNGETTKVPYALAQVRVRLELLPTGRSNTSALTAETGVEVEEQILVVRTGLDRDITALEGPSSQVATLLQIEGIDDLGIIEQSVLSMALDMWFNENLASFRHVFATVNIAKITAEDSSGAFDWLKPTLVSYAYGHNVVTPEDGVLAILGQTSGRDADGLIQQVQAEMIPPGNDACICISKRRFLRDMIGKALPKAFKGLKPSHITYKSRDGGIRVTRPVELEAVPHDGKTYDSKLERLDITLRETDMQVESRTRTETSPGIYALAAMQASYNFGMIRNKSGQKTMGYEVIGKPKTQEWTEKDKAVEISQLVAGILAAVVGIAAIVVSGGTATIALGVVAGILAGTSMAIGIAEKVAEGDGPPLDLLIANATSSVVWSSGRRFDPTMITLNGGLQMAGNFQEAKAPVPGALTTEAPRASYQKAFQAEFADIMDAREKEAAK